MRMMQGSSESATLEAGAKEPEQACGDDTDRVNGEEAGAAFGDDGWPCLPFFLR